VAALVSEVVGGSWSEARGRAGSETADGTEAEGGACPEAATAGATPPPYAPCKIE